MSTELNRWRDPIGRPPRWIIAPERLLPFVQVVSFLVLLAWFGALSARKIDLTTGGIDLGRHLKNGELLLSSAAPSGTVAKILHSNFYSYAFPEAPFVHHHWLADVILFLVYRLAGFGGLNLFYILLGAVVFCIFFRLAHRAAGFCVAFAAALALLPVLRVRPSVRPEVFTYLMCGIFLTVLWRAYNDPPQLKRLLVLPVLEALWVNLHIGFILGPFLIVLFLLAEPLAKPGAYREVASRVKTWLAVLPLTLGATLVNPSGIKGALYPITVWSNYGFRVSENQSLTVLEALGYQEEFLLVKVMLVVLGLSFFLAAWRSVRFPLPLLILAIAVGGLTWNAFRNYPLAAYFSLAIIPINLGLSRLKPVSRRQWWIKTAVLSLVILSAGYYGVRKLPGREKAGLGLLPGTGRAAEFFRANHLSGPIFNNYNIGGYLIHYLFPEEKVYVDSRPEAYPASFFQVGYDIPLRSEERWEDLEGIYGFQAILFSPSVPLEENFIIQRILDPLWAPVYFDKKTIIFVKRTARNQQVISRYEIPKDRLIHNKPATGKKTSP